MAAIIGRHRIDDALKVHFRNIMSPSSQVNLSRYVDIALHAGAGPTVQEALKDGNPANLSMILQLSFLAHACNDENLTFALTTAIESILESQGASAERAPDYVSLLGTIRACQQQTAAFRWNYHFQAVEAAIKQAQSGRDSMNSSDPRLNKKQKTHVSESPALDFSKARGIKYYALKTLMMWLPTLQSFPEERHLYIRCSTGLCTIIVWCHYTLGLTVLVRIDECEISFGSGQPVVTLEAAHNKKEDIAVIYDVEERSKPLFTLCAMELDPEVGPESFVDAYGSGKRLFESLSLDQAVIEQHEEQITQIALGLSRDRWSYSEYPSGMDVLKAARFLFANDALSAGCLRYSDAVDSIPNIGLEFRMTKSLLSSIFAFSRVRDIQRCKNFQIPCSILDSGKGAIPTRPFTLVESFEYLSLILFGADESYSRFDDVSLASGRGWSIFLDCFDAKDPSDIDITYLYLQPGVPARKGVRKIQIIDAQIQTRQNSLAKYWSKDLPIFPGLRSASRGSVLIGESESAFLVARIINFTSSTSDEVLQYRLGLREMMNLRLDVSLISACKCPSSSSPSSWEVSGASMENCGKSNLENFSLVFHKLSGLGRAAKLAGEDFKVDEESEKEEVFAVLSGFRNSTIECFYVGWKEAARWLFLINSNEIRKAKHPDSIILLAHHRCCLSWAVQRNFRRTKMTWILF